MREREGLLRERESPVREMERAAKDRDGLNDELQRIKFWWVRGYGAEFEMEQADHYDCRAAMHQCFLRS